VCLEGQEAKPLVECSKNGIDYRLYVLQNFRSTLVALDLNTGAMLDLDPFTPTANGIKLPGQVHDLVTAPGGSALYVAASPNLLIRVDVPDHKITEILLPISPKRIIGSPVSCDGTGDCGNLASDSGLFLLSTDGRQIFRFFFEDGVNLNDSPYLLPPPPEELSDIAVGQGKLIGTAVDGRRLMHLRLDSSKEPDEQWRYITLNPACSDGLDNDNDGSTDGQDPDCDAPSGSSENPTGIHGCSNGEDDDDDGLVDMDDPGCTRSADNNEWSDAGPCDDGIDNDGDGCTDPPLGDGCGDADNALSSGCNLLGGLQFETSPCEDGLDNDGDGTTDADDEDCTEGPGEFPHAAPCGNGEDDNGNGLFDAPIDPICVDTSSIAEHTPACSDGADNDGDSYTDADDPDCYGPYGHSEQQLAKNGRPLIRVHPEQPIAYVLRPVQRDIVAVNLTDGEIIENHQDFPLWEQGAFPDTPLSGLPAGMVFTRAAPDPNDGEEAEEGESTILKAYVVTRSGRVTVYDPSKHRPKPLSEDPTAVLNQPSLTVTGAPVDIRYSLPEGVPHMGRFTVDKDTNNFYGITLTANPQNVPAEVWTVSSGAIIGDTESFSGRILENNRSFHDPGAHFCSAGVEPGDILEILPGASVVCGDLQGSSFRATIDSVKGETLTFDGSTIQAQTSSEQEIGSFESVEAQLSPACLVGPLHYRVRVAPETFLVEGQKTGLLHPWKESTLGECEKTTTDPLWTSRAKIGTLKEDVEPQSCPITTDDPAVKVATFENPIFRFALTPACALESFRPSYPAAFEGVVYRFITSSDWNQSTLMAGSSGGALVAPLAGGPVVFIDPSSETIYLIDPATNSLSQQLN